jgi:hypothetical protein
VAVSLGTAHFHRNSSGLEPPTPARLNSVWVINGGGRLPHLNLNVRTKTQGLRVPDQSPKSGRFSSLSEVLRLETGGR